MRRLIDADALKAEAWEVSCKDMYHMTELVKVVSVEEIDSAPTVDAVEVVRCKDCLYMTEHYDVDSAVPYWNCYHWDSETDYDGYCYYGERKIDTEKERVSDGRVETQSKVRVGRSMGML